MEILTAVGFVGTEMEEGYGVGAVVVTVAAVFHAYALACRATELVGGAGTRFSCTILLI